MSVCPCLALVALARSLPVPKWSPAAAFLFATTKALKESWVGVADKDHDYFLFRFMLYTRCQDAFSSSGGSCITTSTQLCKEEKR